MGPANQSSLGAFHRDGEAEEGEGLPRWALRAPETPRQSVPCDCNGPCSVKVDPLISDRFLSALQLALRRQVVSDAYW